MPRTLLTALVASALGFGLFGQAQAQPKGKGARPADAKHREPPATPAESLHVLKGFRAELLYSVPKDQEGSWVSMCVDPKGRLYVSDQYGGLYRVTPPPTRGEASATRVEKVPLPIGEAQGMTWAFDSLYVVVNRGARYDSGLYRLRDTNGDDMLDEVKQLRKIDGGGEHGPHAVIPGPDGKSLYVLCGNHTKLTKIDSSRVPQVWGEDHLLPRMWDAGGHAVGILAPGGHVLRTDPDGAKWELVTIGFRNEYDAAFNRQGDLFTYDADMEWDINTPWYRPTRVCAALSGAEFGWRSGTGKWPAYYPDSLPPAVDVGFGSPTGVTFGYGARFPAKYQEAYFMCDWSYGKLYAAHVRPQGAGYTAEFEEFVTGSPLPLTDIVVSPKDGALYFTTGGRKTKSGLYRVTYTGAEPTDPLPPPGAPSQALTERRKLESFHGHADPKAVETAWPYLSNPDRYLRYAARVAVEFQPVAEWQDRALAEKEPEAAINAAVALARHGDKSLQPKLIDALQRLDWKGLSYNQRLELMRAYALAFIRMGRPDEALRTKMAAYFGPLYPAEGRELNAELCQMLVYLQDPGVAAKTMKLLAQAPTQEEQLQYALALRALRAGWTPELRKQYFEWFVKAANYKGGYSFAGFVRNIKSEAVALLTPEEKKALQPILDAQPKTQAVVVKPRPLVKQWKLDELTDLVTDQKLTGRDFDRGRRLFAEASCFACHRFGNEGGATGPDLTGAAGRFSVRDLLESIVEPSKVISDQYAAVNITTDDGRRVTGRIANLNGDHVMVMENMLDPGKLTNVDRRSIESIEPSKVSMMPTGLMNTLHEDEVLDLMAYLLSRGDRSNKMFKK